MALTSFEKKRHQKPETLRRHRHNEPRPITLDTRRIISFRGKVLLFYARHRRELPFRETCDPYKIAVSEVMLQQTQVERVVPKWKSWICRWPNWQSLSKATNRQLLIEWQGLGYNRRALALGAMARDIVRKWHGETPRDIETLLALPGIGPYTANAILIFAYNEPCIAIDTNIRRVLMHELGLPSDISRANLEQVAQLVLPKTRSRDWHNALMDYSAIALPKSIPSIPPATKQSRFKGSLRELRGEIIRELTKKRLVTIQQIATKTHRDIPDVRRAAESLEKENVISLTRDRIRLR